MEDSIKQIGQRLKGLREVLDIPAEEVAEVCGVSLEHYLKMEEGKADPSVYRLSKISKRYGIALDVLLFGEEPRMKGYFLTRRGNGVRCRTSGRHPSTDRKWRVAIFPCSPYSGSLYSSSRQGSSRPSWQQA